MPEALESALAAEEAEAARIRALNLPKPTDRPTFAPQPPPRWRVGIFHEDLEQVLAPSVEMTTIMQGWFGGQRVRVAAGSSKTDPTAGALDIRYFSWRYGDPRGGAYPPAVRGSGPLEIVGFNDGVVRLTDANGTRYRYDLGNNELATQKGGRTTRR